MPNAAPFTGDTVPLGEAGTGAAYILPQSQAINQASDYIDQAQQQRAQAAAAAKLAAQQQAQKFAADWQKNRLNIKSGTLWQPEINQKVNDVMQEGLSLRQAGIDPQQYYNDDSTQAKVDAYNQHYQEAMNMANVRDDYAKKAALVDADISKAVPGELDPASIQAYHDFFTKNKLSDLITNGGQMPDVTKAYNLDAAIKANTNATSKEDINVLGGQKISSTVADEDNHRVQAQNMMKNDVATSQYVAKQMGMTPDQANSLTDKTDLPGIINDLNNHFRSPENIPALGRVGINSYGQYVNQDTPDDGVNEQTSQDGSQQVWQDNHRYMAYINAMGQEIYQAKKTQQNIENTIVNKLNSQISPKTNIEPNYDIEDQNMKRVKFGQANTEFNQEQEDRQNPATYNIPGSLPIYGHHTLPGDTQQGDRVTYPAQIQGGIKDVIATPSKVLDPTTGKIIKNTTPISFQAAQPTLMRFIVYTDKNGIEHQIQASDQQVQDAKDGTLLGANNEKLNFQDNIKHIWMTNGLTDKKVPKMILQPVKKNGNIVSGPDGKQLMALQPDPTGAKVTVKAPISVPTYEIGDAKYNKNLNTDAAEVKLAPDIQYKMIADKIKQRYPNLSNDDLGKAVLTYYNSRLNQYKNQ